MEEEWFKYHTTKPRQGNILALAERMALPNERESSGACNLCKLGG